jgi:hypothetical protein
MVARRPSWETKNFDRRHGVEKDNVSYESVRTILVATIKLRRRVFPFLLPGKAERVA